MVKWTCIIRLGAFAALIAAGPAHAAFHLWDIKEIYTNHDGSVQFIELFTNAGSQQFVDDHQIVATSDGNAVTFTFPSNSGAPTTNRHLLIATPGFGALAGSVAPNFTLPVGPFFDPVATSITINFAGADSVTFAGAALPKDGVNSLTDANLFGVANLMAGTNSPTNFAGATGSVNLPPPPSTTGDYNANGTIDAADYVVWRDTLGATVTPGDGADGDESGTIDAGDYTFWKTHFGETVPGAGGLVAAAVPEPASGVFLLAATLLAAVRPFRFCRSMAVVGQISLKGAGR